MAKLGNVIKISKSDYDTLVGGGTITKGGVTYSYDANAIYLIAPEAVGSATQPVYVNNSGDLTAANTMVDLTSTQTITGEKTFSEYGKFKAKDLKIYDYSADDYTSIIDTDYGNWYFHSTASNGNIGFNQLEGKLFYQPQSGVAYRNFTLPSQSGTLALTSDINPGTITGVQLNGESIASSGVANVQALPNFSLNISHQTAGNPRQVKFLTIDYVARATYFKMSATSCHDNGTSYQFLEDIIIGCTTSGTVVCNVYKYCQQSCTLDGVTRYYGDVFYVIDTTNKTVDFYILCGQYASSQFTPATKIGNTTIGYVRQYTGTAEYYSSGTKVWADGCGTTYARKDDIPTISASASEVSGATEAKSLTINGTSWNLPSGGGSGITEISTQYIRIWDLAAGVYKLTYNGTKYLYYMGATSTNTQTVQGGNGAVILTVNNYSSNSLSYKHWYYINGSTSYATLYYGYVYETSGSVASKAINNLLTSHQTMYYRPIKVSGTQRLSNTSSAALNIAGGTGINVTWESSGNTVKIASSSGWRPTTYMIKARIKYGNYVLSITYVGQYYSGDMGSEHPSDLRELLYLTSAGDDDYSSLSINFGGSSFYSTEDIFSIDYGCNTSTNKPLGRLDLGDEWGYSSGTLYYLDGTVAASQFYADDWEVISYNELQIS